MLYPASPGRRCRVRPLNRVPAVSPNGSPRDPGAAAGLVRAAAFEVEVEHRWTSPAELSALRVWLATARHADVDVAARDGRTYRCRVLDREYRERARRGPFATVSLRLAGRVL